MYSLPLCALIATVCTHCHCVHSLPLCALPLYEITGTLCTHWHRALTDTICALTGTVCTHTVCTDWHCMQLRGTAITDVGLSQMHGLTALTELDLGSNKCLSDRPTCDLIKNFPLLEKLSLSYCRGVGDATCAAIASTCPSLRRLEMAGTAVTDSGVQLLAPLAALEVLDLTNNCITDVAAGALLGGLPALRCLDLGRCSCTDVSMGEHSRRVTTQLNWCQQTCCNAMWVLLLAAWLVRLV